MKGKEVMLDGTRVRLVKHVSRKVSLVIVLF